MQRATWKRQRVILFRNFSFFDNDKLEQQRGRIEVRVFSQVKITFKSLLRGHGGHLKPDSELIIIWEHKLVCTKSSIEEKE